MGLGGAGKGSWEGGLGASRSDTHQPPPRPSQSEQELRVAQTEFDRQAEVTRLLLEGISSTHVSPLPTSSFLIRCHHSCPH